MAQAHRLVVSPEVADFFSNDVSPLTASELGALFSLLSFVAANNSMDRDVVLERLTSRFCLEEIDGLSRKNFNHAVSFLLNLGLDEDERSQQFV